MASNDDIWLQGQAEVNFLKEKYPHVDDETIDWLVQNRAGSRQRIRKAKYNRESYQCNRESRLLKAKIRNERKQQLLEMLSAEEQESARSTHLAAHRAAQEYYRIGKRQILADKEKERRRKKRANL
ncbi:hypothetical protein K435DRAFT_798270 [Dendrothele bispora CBS 962.96]|uniref:Uncharacterized protein n=1 Tax=Dendrothele bispora (strain CBS 962.96) TaxID=1314807 RepID=A0A4S8LZR8_DENBC|nr:hypothetical protein K435DRAFT_798270 [Dendrothele bispora CBS 962.96]